MAVVIRRLEEQDNVESFDCGDEPLNNFLKRHAWANQQKSSIGVTCLAVDEAAPFSVIGYFALATSSVATGRLPKAICARASTTRIASDSADPTCGKPAQSAEPRWRPQEFSSATPAGLHSHFMVVVGMKQTIRLRIHFSAGFVEGLQGGDNEEGRLERITSAPQCKSIR